MMSQIQIRRPKTKTATSDRELDLRTPSGRQLPY
jgi:hypothetical protein